MPLLSFTRKRSYKTLDNGIIDLRKHPFAQYAAATPDGQYYVADGYYYRDEFQQLRDALIKAGKLPPQSAHKTVSVAQIQTFYANSGAAAAEDLTSGAKRLLNIITAAAAARASDIKIYQHESETYVRFRVAGREENYGHPMTPDEGITAMRFAFDAREGGGGDATMKDNSFQSFSITHSEKFPLPRNVVKLRGQRGFHESTTRAGSFMIFRIFYRDDEDTGSIDDLGFDKQVLDALARARADMKGCVIIGGETGDGKSTTLIRTIQRLYEEHSGSVGIITLEDPVEYRVDLPGVIQIPLRSSGTAAERETHYREALRSFVRSNPDVGMISEIRDGTGGREALQFATSGHALYSTVHAASANDVLFRLINMGVPATEAAQPGIIRLLLKQTLVPILCADCKIPLLHSDIPRVYLESVRHLEPHFNQMALRNDAGCPSCTTGQGGEIGAKNWAGYDRQVAVGEVIEPNDAYLRAVQARDAIEALHIWRRPTADGGLGGITISQKITQLVIDGKLDMRDARRKHADLSELLTPDDKRTFRWRA